MNDPTKADVRKDAPSVTGAPTQEKESRPYEPPTMQIFSEEQILQEVGPAQGYTTLPTQL